MSKTKRKGSVFGKNKKDQVINIALLIVLIFVSLNLINEYYLLFGSNQQELLLAEKEENVLLGSGKETEKEEFKAPIVDVENWKSYSNNWYGFEIKYPSDWSGPYYQKYQNNSKWEYKYSFYRTAAKRIGYQLIVYNNRKIESFFQTDEFPNSKSSEKCGSETGHINTEDSSAKELHIDLNDECLDNAFFYVGRRSDEEGNYLLVFNPLVDSIEGKQDKRKVVKSKLPEFFGFVTSYKEIDIKRPTALEIARANAPLPVKFKWENGRRVCEKDNDKPKKSKKGKGHHLDMECCLDPDEDPNPHCYYPPEKYGDLLN